MAVRRPLVILSDRTVGELPAADQIDGAAQRGDALVTARNPGSGWLEQGRVYLQATYPDLFAMVGLIGDMPPGRNWASYTPTTGITTGVNDACWLTDRIAVAVGNAIIWRTVDGGVNWTSQAVTGNYTSVVRITADIALTTGVNGVMLRSTDSGASWTPVTSGTSTTINAITVLSATRALIHVNSTNATLSVRLSTNAGASWSAVTAGPAAAITATVRFSANVVVGFPTSGTSAYRSTNGGDTWSTITIPSAQTAIGGAFAFTDTIGVTGSNNPLRSTDAGLTWVLQTATHTGTVRAVESASPGSAVIMSTTTPAVTFDYGATWAAVSGSLSASFNAAFAIPEESIMGVGNAVAWRSLPEYAYDPLTQFKVPSQAGLGAGLKGYIKA